MIKQTGKPFLRSAGLGHGSNRAYIYFTIYSRDIVFSHLLHVSRKKPELRGRLAQWNGAVEWNTGMPHLLLRRFEEHRSGTNVNGAEDC